MEYIIDDLVKVAKRDNNSIRPYLFVNPKQGKHIPANPSDVLDMCKCLAQKINNSYVNEKIYIIGFAETATGIAAAVASYVDNALYYQNTTREKNNSSDYLFFTESHSHATDQMLRIEFADSIIQEVDRIVFVDDEVTTGCTICRLIDELRKRYKKTLKFCIVSVLNSMISERISELQSKGVDILSLMNIPFEYKRDYISQVFKDYDKHILCRVDSGPQLQLYSFNCRFNPRNGVFVKDYINEINKYAEKVVQLIESDHYNNCLIIGTEEYMYPTFLVGKQLLEKGISQKVRVHSTSRSPIIASGDENYPLYSRYQIRSLYDDERITYIYNLEKYEKVIILTDAFGEIKGVYDLINALKSVGCEDISIVRCKYEYI